MPGKRLGRPPKGFSEAKLVHRFQIMLSNEDKVRLTAMLALTGAKSEGEVFRNALRRDFERVTGQKA
jgi:hypothetical protein